MLGRDPNRPQVLKYLLCRAGFVERVKVDAWSSFAEQLLALLRGVPDADARHGFQIRPDFFKLLLQRQGERHAAKDGEPTNVIADRMAEERITRGKGASARAAE